MKDQKKRRGFMCMFIYCSSPSSHFQAWHLFHVHVKWVGYPLPSSQDYSIESISSPTGYSSGHPWRLVSISSSQCCQVILFDVPISLKIVCLKVYQLYSPLYHSPMYQSYFDHYIIYPCFVSIGYINAFLRWISS